MSESSCLIAPESEGGDGCSSPRGHFRPLKIAILGTRGIPASYGGFETFAQEISHELVQRGHSVVVYCRRPFLKSTAEELAEYNGVELRYVPTFYHKYLETVVHSLFSFVHVLLNPVDIVLLCNAANSPWSFLAKLRGIPVAVNLDGIERKRGKWNLFGRTWYSLGEICSVWFARELVADAEVIASYYKDRYAADSHVIAYGARCRRSSATQVVSELGLKPQNYLLYVSRLEPENNALGVIEAYSRVQTRHCWRCSICR